MELKAESFLKIFNKKELSIEDLTYLSKLLDTGLALSFCFDLLKNKRNKTIFEDISKKLEDGVMIEDAINGCLPKVIEAYMLPLLKKISFSEALSLSLKFYEKNNETNNKLISNIAYPCILLFVTVTALYLFDLYGIDAIFELLASFSTDLHFFESVRMVFRIIIQGFYYGILLVIIVVIVFSRPSKLPLLYIYFSKHFPNSLINTYYSEEFVSLLLVCVDKGYKTKEALTILKSMKSKPIVSFLAFHLDDALMQGEALKDATKKVYYDSSLSRFIKIANYTNDFSNILTNYTNLTREKINNKMKKYTLTIQIATYGFIGVIVVFIYEVLFLPMQAISSF